MSIGIWQIAIVVILVVLLFGRGKISSLMGDVAKGIKSFKKGMASDVTDDNEPKNISENNKDTNNPNDKDKDGPDKNPKNDEKDNVVDADFEDVKEDKEKSA